MRRQDHLLRPAHGFGFSDVDLETAYTPPAVAGIADPVTRLVYSPDQDLKRVLRPDGSTLDLNYDNAGRLTSLVPSAGAGEPITLGYSATTGQLATLGTTDATHSFTYDGALPKTETLAGGVLTGTMAWDYDASFRVNRLTVGGAAVDFGFDADSLLTQAGSLTISRSAQHGMPTATTVGGVTTTQTYNGFGEPELFSASHGGTALYSVQLAYDRAGRITGKTEVVQGVSTIYEYGYDSAARLAQVKQNGTLVVTYGYDGNGNRTQVNGATVAAFDDQDRLLTHGTATYTHTAAGAWASKVQGAQTTTYGYDIHGNLRSVTLPGGGQIGYLVDARNRRIGKRVNGVITQRWLYESDLRIAAEVDAAGVVQTRFVYGLRPNVPEYMVRGGVTYRLITDHLGSVRLVVNATSGAVAQRIDYDEWGKVTSDSNPGFQPFGFAGGLYDADTGLVRFGARDYDAATGRWTAKDPIGFAGGDSNLYAYVGGNPLSMTDPSGLFGWADMPTVPQSVVDFGAGMGDVILFGQGQRIRDWFDIGGVDRCSSAYDAGEWAGIAAGFATGVAGGIKAAGTKGLGREFSHWIPNRMGGPRSPMNGNFVSTEVHALSDPFRYRFMPRAWKAANPMPSRLDQQWVRIPNVYKGAGAGAAYGAGGAAMNDCTCQQ